MLEPDAYLAALNAYFECTAGAAMEAGGEVLLLIGDAVLAIFPIGDGGASVGDVGDTLATRGAWGRCP